MSRFVLIGNPNSGKSTLFNALTGGHQTVGNWAGVTTEAQKGLIQQEQHSAELVDLPGLYTAFGFSKEAPLDERISQDFIKHQDYDLLLNVVDATHLDRQLYLTLQLLELKKPLIVVLTMMDLLSKKHKSINLELLTKELGCPVIALGRDYQKVSDLKKALFQQIALPAPLLSQTIPALEPCLQKLTDVIEGSPEHVSLIPARANAFGYLESDIADCPPAFQETVTTISNEILNITGFEADIALAMARFECIDSLVARVVQKTEHPAHHPYTAWVDRVVLNRFWGFPIFLMVMYALFSAAIRVGGALETGVDTIAHHFLVDKMAAFLHSFEAPTLLIALIAHGLGEGLSTVAAFVPVLGVLFLTLSFLEDCGYMARAAFVIDKCMQSIGLPGKSFVPMIIGFGCNVPAIMAARTLERERDRILTIMMSPFMSCGARLAIYTLFVSVFFPINGANIVFALYLLGIVVAVITGWLLRKTVLMGELSPLIMELPAYRWPKWQTVGRHTVRKLKQFLWNAGRLIIPVCMVIGALNTWTWEKLADSKTGAPQTVLAWVGKEITPVFKPMGLDENNWPATVALLTGVMAKEVVVGTLNALYTQEAAFHAEGETAMGVMARYFDGQAGAFAYLIFMLLYFPCISATSAIAKEINGRWSFFSVLWSTGVAYALAVIFYQATHWVHWVSLGWIVGMIIGLVVGFKWISRLVKGSRPRMLPTKIRVQAS